MNNKYRVWDKSNNQWKKDNIFISPDGKIFKMLPTGELIQAKEEQYIIQQYTGLHDKNGKKIYEGDIVNEPSWWWGPGYVILNIGSVGPCKSPCVMSWETSKNSNLWDFDKIEVIGNVFEDKEKLNF